MEKYTKSKNSENCKLALTAPKIVLLKDNATESGILGKYEDKSFGPPS